jgi:hypothetical protein
LLVRKKFKLNIIKAHKIIMFFSKWACWSSFYFLTQPFHDKSTRLICLGLIIFLHNSNRLYDHIGFHMELTLSLIHGRITICSKRCVDRNVFQKLCISNKCSIHCRICCSCSSSIISWLRLCCFNAIIVSIQISTLK